MKFRKKYTKKKYAKHTRKRKYKQKNKRTHNRKGLKKRKRTRRKRGGWPKINFSKPRRRAYGDCKTNIFPKNIDFMEDYTKDSDDDDAAAAVYRDDRGTLFNQPQVTDLHIIFSHKGRMQCILQHLKDASVSEPKNGAIIVIAQRNNNREIRPEDTFYDPSQYKNGNDIDGGFIQNFSDWFNNYSREQVTLFIFVRHGVGWHNLDSNKTKKWFMKDKIKGQNWDSSLDFDKSNLDALTDVSAPLLQQLLEKINENSRNPEIIKPKLYCSDLQRTMQTAKIVLAGIDIIPNNDVVYILPCNHEFSCKDSEKNVNEAKNENKYENVTSLPDEAWGSIPDEADVAYKPLQNDIFGYLAFYNGNVRGKSYYETPNDKLLTQLGKTEAHRHKAAVEAKQRAVARRAGSSSRGADEDDSQRPTDVSERPTDVSMHATKGDPVSLNLSYDVGDNDGGEAGDASDEKNVLTSRVTLFDDDRPEISDLGA